MRFVFKGSFRPLCRLVIRTWFPVLKVVNQATGVKPDCLLNLTKICMYPSFLFVFCKRISPLVYTKTVDSAFRAL